MITKNIMLALAAAAGLAVPGWCADASSTLNSAAAVSGGKVSDVPAASSKYVSDDYWTRDCARFNFNANSPMTSEKTILTSYHEIRDCHFVPDPVPPPQPPQQQPQPNQPNNQPGGPGGVGPRGESCHIEVIGSKYMYARVRFSPQRQLLPWETENYEICLQENYSNLSERKTAYEYRRGYDGEAMFVLAPVKKIATPAVGNGMSGAFAYDGKTVTLSVSDQSARFYKGEQIQITAKLIQDHTFWFDDLLDTQTVSLATAPGYTVSFNRTLPSGGRYFVQWGFKRIGKVSKDNYVDMGNTNRMDVR